MDDVIVSVESVNGYPGGNEPTAKVLIRNITLARAFKVSEGYGNAGYEDAVREARTLAAVLGVPWKKDPIGKYLSELEREQ